MSEALPASYFTRSSEAAHCGGGCTDLEGDEHLEQAQASRAVELADALRKAKKLTPEVSGGSGGNPRNLIEDVILDAQDSLERRIRAHLAKGSVTVTLTDNRYTMISVRRAPRKQYDIRLHHMFADADPVITRALARYIAENDPKASRVLGDFIDQNTGNVRESSLDPRHAPPTLLFTAGEHHDLLEIFDELNAQYFGDKIDAQITWGARTGRPKRRNSIKMGSYVVEDRLIRIHRSLDRAFVPRYFVAWIVFHEMLHQVHDIKVGRTGRREFHSKDFLSDEAQFQFYEEARAFERAYLDELLTY